MKKTIWQRAILGVFILLIGGFTLVSLVKPQTDFSEMENRALQMRPDWEADDILSGDFQEDYEAYLSDQFVLRDIWVDVRTFCSRILGQKESNGVYFGKQDYLIEKYAYADFDPELVEENLQHLADFLNGASEDYGESHVACLFAPSKGTVLTNRLPDWADAYDTSWVLEQLKNKLDSPAMLLDGRDALAGHEEEYIYYRTDHHWTTLGAYYAYGMYCERQGGQVAALETYTPVEVSDAFYGTTYDKVHMAVEPDRVWRYDSTDTQPVEVVFDDGETWDSCYDETALEEKDKYTYFFGGNSSKIVLKGNCASGKNLLLVKDSFANCFAPFLLEQYEKVVMVDLRYVEEYIEELASGEKITDVLVLFNREKFMADQNLFWLERNGAEEEVLEHEVEDWDAEEPEDWDEDWDAEEPEDWDEDWDAEEPEDWDAEEPEDWDEDWDAEEPEDWDEDWDAEEPEGWDAEEPEDWDEDWDAEEPEDWDGNGNG